MIKLSWLPADGGAEVWVKLEGANPTESYKDRMSLAMIEAAERRGTLRPGQTVVGHTGGSTGSLEVIDSPNGIHPGLIPAMRDRAYKIVDQDGAFATDQFNNRDALDGYRIIGNEILNSSPSR